MRCVRGTDGLDGCGVFAVEGTGIRTHAPAPPYSQHEYGVEAYSDDCFSGAEVPDLDDPATGGILLHRLGVEAWRVRYSPSMHKQAAGTPWIVDLPAVGVDSRQRVYPSLGRACAAVLVALAERVPA